MSRPVLNLRSGPYAYLSSGPNPYITAVSFFLYPITLAIYGDFWPFTVSLALFFLSLAFLRGPLHWPSIQNVILALVLIGPSAGPLAVLAASLTAYFLTFQPRWSKFSFFPGFLAAYFINYLCFLLDLIYPSFNLSFIAFLSITLSLVPAAVLSLIFYPGLRGYKIYLKLATWLVWLLSAFFKDLSLSAHLSYFSFCFILGFFLEPSFWSIRNQLLSSVLILLLGLIPLVSMELKPALILALAAIEPLLFWRAQRAFVYLTLKNPSEFVPIKAEPLKVAVRLCQRPPQMIQTAEYIGLSSCALAQSFDSGPYQCAEACLALGDCRRACPAGAIKDLDQKGAPPFIDSQKCLGCGLCLKACPQELLILKTRNTVVVARCAGSAMMKEMDLLCPNGCLGCARCRKACPAGAISKKVSAMGPVADEEKCLKFYPDCGLACQQNCPRSLPSLAL
ncbi:MAG: 4Fe-4S binding protein [Deltaproteobacteria bacterium]|nr:4Fe-4S binding protein [Deltaproteobacteria bacterium]